MFFSDSRVEGVIASIQKNTRSLLSYSMGFYIFYAVVCQIIARVGFVSFAEPITLGAVFFNQFLSGGSYKFTAAYWFIPCLFFLKLYFSIVHSRIFSTLFSRKVVLGRIIFLTCYFLIALWAVCFSVEQQQRGLIWTEIPMLRLLFAAFFYYFGCVFVSFGLERFVKNVLVLAVIYVAQQQVWVLFGNLDFWMQISKYQNAYTPVVCSVTAIIFFYGLSAVASSNESIGRVLGYIGRNTLPIVLHHLFGFFVVNLAFCTLGVIKMSNVTGPYYQYDTVHTWPLYIFVGVVYPLVFDRYIFSPVAAWINQRCFALVQNRIP